MRRFVVMAKVAPSIEAESYPQSPLGYSVRSKKTWWPTPSRTPASAMAGGAMITPSGAVGMASRTGQPAIVNSTPLRAAYFAWRRVIGQVLFDIEENRRVVSAPANDCIAFP